MTSHVSPNPTSNESTTSGEWAPWWIYLIVLLGANHVRAYVVPGGSLPLPVIVAIAVGQSALLFVIVTAIWRASQRRRN